MLIDINYRKKNKEKRIHTSLHSSHTKHDICLGFVNTKLFLHATCHEDKCYNGIVSCSLHIQWSWTSAKQQTMMNHSFHIKSGTSFHYKEH